ncbi:MAG TPA: methyltransferase domain-containing protein [Planctomycetota bacterium]|nr:methyltransferase domain-containing protein [Planctomycetota bacterium]
MASQHEWFTNEEFWADMFPVMFPEAGFQHAAQQTGEVIKLAGVEKGNVLDLCCGPGRFALPLATRGFHVTGVDRTEILLKDARKRAHAAKLQIEWVREDMRTFVRPNAFDLALNLFSSFGYFDNPDEDLQVLRNLHASLRPNGALVIDAQGKESLAARLQSVIYDAPAPGLELIQRIEVGDDWTRLYNEWILIREERVKRYRFALRIYSGQELRDRLRQAGFSTVALYGDLAGSAYGVRSTRLVAVARKAARRSKAK